MKINEIDQKIKELEKIKEKQKKVNKLHTKDKLYEFGKSCIGKTFVRIIPYNNTFTFSILRLEKVYRKKNFNEEIRVSGSRISISLLNPVHKISKKRLTLSGNIDITFFRDIEKTTSNASRSFVHIISFDEELHSSFNDIYNNSITIGYSKNRYNVQKDSNNSLFERIIKDSVLFNQFGINLFSYLWEEYDRKTAGWKLEKESSPSIYSETFYSQFQDALSYCEENKIELKQLIEPIKKVSRWNYFSNDNRILEFRSYKMNVTDKGIYGSISSGDAGTDYEPYITHYILNAVTIDWFHILYPIRTLLKTSVKEAVVTLEMFGYDNIEYWNCEYDNSSWNARYKYIELKSQYLDKLNNQIKELLI